MLSETYDLGKLTKSDALVAELAETERLWMTLRRAGMRPTYRQQYGLAKEARTKGGGEVRGRVV